jgi:predicted DNA-binding ribbon-helix-helix protein
VRFTADHLMNAASRAEPYAMKKHSITIEGHRTSISLEAEFWQLLKLIAAERQQTVAQLVRRRNGGLSSALRLFVLAQISAKAGIDIDSLAGLVDTPKTAYNDGVGMSEDTA